MGFFKDFKEDFNDAVGEMTGEAKTNASSSDIDVDSELSKLDSLLSQASKKIDEGTAAAPTYRDIEPEIAPTPVVKSVEPISPAPASAKVNDVSNENAIITSCMKVTGNLETTGSVEVAGVVAGDIHCNGKLVVTGTIYGNSSVGEFFADAAKVSGEVACAGTVKVGVGSVIIGNISATSAVIAGAVKGDIDVNGPVIVDTSAVVMGNIKSKSVQINNGAVIEGYCSQAYADVDVNGVFGN